MKTRKMTAAMKAHASTLPRYNFIDFQRHAINEIGRAFGVPVDMLLGQPRLWDTARYVKPVAKVYKSTAEQMAAQMRGYREQVEQGLRPAYEFRDEVADLPQDIDFSQVEARVAAVAESVKDLERYRSSEDRAKRIADAFNAVGVASGVTAKKWARDNKL